jgi:hypothetical protein
MQRLHAMVPFLLGLVLLSGLAACGDDDAAGTGTLRISMIDAPGNIEGLEAITLVLSGVRIHASENAEGGQSGGWMDVMPDSLSEAERTFDLLELVNGVEAVLGEVVLEAGQYTQIRLMIESATITISGETSPLFIPSGMQSGLKLIHPFTIRTNEVTALTLDFDAARSVYEAPPASGNYRLKPTVRVVQNGLSGSITGTVTPLAIDAMVAAIHPASGDTVTTTFVSLANGGYELGALLPGNYHVAASAPGYVAAVDSNVAVQAATVTPDVDFVLEPEMP